MSNLYRTAAAACVALMLMSCNAAQSTDLAEKQSVPHFHEQFNAGNFDGIYNEATDAFRNSASKAEYDKLMQTVRHKLGRVKSTSRQGWNVNVGTGGTQIILTYKTEFENGSGTELFAFIGSKGTAKLLHYQVNSNALITQ